MSWIDDTRDAWIAWLGGTPPPSNDQATRALTLALSTVETYLDRPLELLERTEEAWGATGVLRLRAWPVSAVSALTINGQAIDLEHITLDKRTGRLAAPAFFAPAVVTYTAGFDPFPADLEFALWLVAAELYPGTVSAAGAATGQAIKRVTSPDAGTVEYATASQSEAQADQLLGGSLPPQAESLLSRYRAEGPVGGA